jgi:hypothetical protein
MLPNFISILHLVVMFILFHYVYYGSLFFEHMHFNLHVEVELKQYPVKQSDIYTHNHRNSYLIKHGGKEPIQIERRGTE